MTCCFLGHKDTPPSVRDRLEATVEKLIIEQNVTSFLVGNQGQFDSMALTVLRNMKKKYPAIDYHIVLAYMPAKKTEWNPYEYWETLLPEGMESVHPRYAISKRNEWLLAESDIIVCYITHSWGDAAKYVSKAMNKKKTIINIAL